jgi:hypothetical protein
MSRPGTSPLKVKASRRTIFGGYNMKRYRRITSLFLASLLLTSLPTSVSAYGINTYNGHFTTEKPENVTCVSASALTWINYLTGATNYTHTLANTWYLEARNNGYDKYNLASVGEAGLDPRGWANLLWHHRPAHYAFNDYRYTSQTTADLKLEMDVRDSFEPAGAIIFSGIHAVLVVGFTSNIDPEAGPSTLTGFRIVDPWYPNTPGTEPAGGTIGLAPNTFLDIATWNMNYFTAYADPQYESVHGNEIWHGRFVPILRAADDGPPPSDTQPTPYSDGPQGGGAAALAGPRGVTLAQSKAYPDSAITAALLGGIEADGLTSDNGLGVDLVGISAGRHIHVESLTPSFPSYELVEVQKSGRVVAIAMLVHRSDGLHFGGLQAAPSSNQLPDEALAGAVTKQGGIRSMRRLVWAPSVDSFVPFAPFAEVTDASGRTMLVTPDGRLVSHLDTSRN